MSLPTVQAKRTPGTGTLTLDVVGLEEGDEMLDGHGLVGLADEALGEMAGRGERQDPHRSWSPFSGGSGEQLERHR